MCSAHAQKIGVCCAFPKQLRVSILKTERETEDKISKVFGFDLFVDVTIQGFVSFRFFFSLYFCNFLLHSAEWKFQKIPGAFFIYTVHLSDLLCSPSLLLLNKYIRKDFVGRRARNNSYLHLLIVFFYLTGYGRCLLFSQKNLTVGCFLN